MDFEARYKQLNAAQKQAVDCIDGPVMVIAGPGTGKTELLSMRVANILKQTDTLPENILCLTFTDSGADAMRDRLVSIIGQAGYKVAIHTFHSFGSEIINQNAEFFYHGASFQAADELSSFEVLRSIFDELDFTNPLASKMNDDYVHLSDVRTVISEFKKSGLTGSELLAIIDDNELVIDATEKRFAEVFNDKISAKTVDALLPIAATLNDYKELDVPPEVTPFSHVLALSLTHAIEQAQTIHPTKPITKWKNQWLEKDDTNAFVFKSRKRHVKLRAAVAIYESYLARMQEAELFDFDDMILQVVHAMETQPDLRFNLQEKYQYIMVDEFQDTNMAQARILHDLTDSLVNEGKPNIMVVGDDDQAIYSFQGADVSNIINFRSRYPETVLITLTNNYRSTGTILEAARSVITQGSDRLENYIPDLNKTLSPHHTASSSKLVLLSAQNRDDENHFIVSSIKQRIKAGESPESIAVLARRHQELIDLLPYFAEADIAVNYEKRDNVLESEPVRLVETLAKLILALADSRHDEVDGLLPELLAHPAWQFSATDIWRLSLSAYTARKKWMELMPVMTKFTQLHTWLIETAKLASYTPMERLLDRLLGNDETDGFKSPLYDYFFSPKKLANSPDVYISYLEALRTIRSKLREYQPNLVPTLESFVEFIDLHKAMNIPVTSVRRRNEASSDAVNLMTTHKSKGLEFDTVYVLGAVDSSWGEKVRSRNRVISYPENLPLAPAGNTLDERLRLFFVAMTRAKSNLIITYPTTTGSGKELLKASFLLPTALMDETTPVSTTAKERLSNIEREWYAPLVAPLTSSMKTVLEPTLGQYKLSATHLNNFLDVSTGGPQHFLLSNLLRFPSAMSAHAAYGSAIHATLQRAHNHLRTTGDRRPEEDILHDFEQQLKEKHLSPAEFDSFLKRGSEALAAFLEEKHASFDANQKVELNFSHQKAMLGDSHLTGALDLVDVNDTDKTIKVTDYKTGKVSRSWQGKTEYEKIKLHKYRQQLMFYKLLIEHSRDFGSYVVDSGSLQFVEPAPNGDIVSLDIDFEKEELADFSKLVQAVWARIIALDLPDTSGYEPTLKGILTFEQTLLETDWHLRSKMIE
ncbi:MAG: ATP-dependent DNA helicase [Candidatus Saccharibacteria bacterium]